MKTKKLQTHGVAGLATIKFPKPITKGGMPLMQALKKRMTTREISAKKIPLQTLSNLLWAATGVNRTKGPFGTPGITTGSASNSQEIRVYAAMEEGVYLYEPFSHCLTPVTAGDLRPLAIGRGQSKWGAKAPVRLIYVADIDRFSKSCFDEPLLHDCEGQKSYYYVDTGLIAANVYLFAASEGLGAWFHNCDRTGLAKKLKLGPKERAIFGQTVGYPEK